MLTNSRVARIISALLSAVLLFFALPPHDIWILGWVALIPLLLSLVGTSIREALLLGGLTGTAANYLAFHWCLELMERFSELGPAAYLIMLLMSLYQAVPWAIWCAALRVPSVSEPTPRFRTGAVLLSATSFIALEFFYPIIFPWYLANTQHTRPETLSLIELGGVSLLSLAMLVCNLILARQLVGVISDDRARLWPARMEGRSPRALLPVLALVVGLMLAWHTFTRHRIEAAMAGAPKFGVGLVQPNEWIGEGSPMLGLHRYQRLTHQLVRECRQAGLPLDLVLWPESAVRTPPGLIDRQTASGESVTELPGEIRRFPLDVSRIYPGNSEPAQDLDSESGVAAGELLALQRSYSVPILFGATLQDMDPEAKGPIPDRAPLYNCGVLIDAAGQVLGVAKKMKLLIFGETIPGSALFPQVYRLLPMSSALLPGKEPQVLTLGTARLGIMICYEDLLPWFHYDLAQKSPQILLNLTNDAWFGKTNEAGAHLALAKLRSVEGRCYLVRSTPTGISAVVDPYGQTVGQIDCDQEGTLQRTVVLLDIETNFERWGDWVAWLSLLYSLVFGVFWWSRGRRLHSKAARS